jgi:hypothetical protein
MQGQFGHLGAYADHNHVPKAFIEYVAPGQDNPFTGNNKLRFT